MFNTEKFGRVALAAVGTLIFTTVSVGAAVGPAHNVEAGAAYALAASQNSVQANG